MLKRDKMLNKQLLEQISNQSGDKATTTIKHALNEKLKEAIEEERIKTAQTVYGAMEESAATTAGIEGRMNYIRQQIQEQGDPGGTRRAALKRMENQVRQMKS